MKPNKLWACLFVLVLIASACGRGDGGGTTAPDSDQTSGNGNGDDGGSDDGDSGNAGTGGEDDSSGAAPDSGDLPASVPDDFPIAIPPGWEVDLNGEIGLTVSAPRLLYSADAYDEIVAFYDEWTAAQPEEYSRGEDPQGGGVTYTGGPEGSVRLITVTANHEERDATWTLLHASGSADDG